jgi:DMSO/TMAO reductase YedYZ molybdopterin-dependent catalytic subunit
VTSSPGRRPARPIPWPGRGTAAGTGAIIGVVTALVALATAQVVAAVLATPTSAPVDAVGAVSINNAPEAVKNWAISEFGSNDKTVLVWGIRGVLLIFAVVIGMLALRRLWLGLAGLAVFAAIGVAAALAQHGATGSYALPGLIGAGIGALALRYFRALAVRGLPKTSDVSPPASAPAGQLGPGQQPASGAAGHAPVPDSEPTADAGPRPNAAEFPADRAAVPATGPVYRPVRPGPAWSGADSSQDRRKFLTASAVVAAGSLVAYGGGSWLASSRNVSAAQRAIRLPRPAVAAPPLPPGADLHIPGLSSFITPNASFYRVDTALVLPEIAPAQWQLRVHGMVRRELVLSFEDLIKRPLIEDYVTLCCVSNPVGGPYIGNAKWLGASLRSLLDEAGVQAGASQLLCTSTDGFTSGTPVVTAMDGRDALVAVAMNDAALPVAHGFPVRLVIPGLYGYVSACKWLVDIEVTTYGAAQAYWVPRGWSAQAPVKTESRIDVPTGQNPLTVGRKATIAGVAWAQHKGIEAVEVRVGNGPWQQAKLAAAPDLDTWRQWAYEWEVYVEPGNYLIEARATDKTGYTQTSLAAPPPPNGASGYPSVSVNVVR